MICLIQFDVKRVLTYLSYVVVTMFSTKIYKLAFYVHKGCNKWGNAIHKDQILY